MNLILLPMQIILIFFIFFAVSRAFLRFREGSLSFAAFLFWALLFTVSIIGILNPDLTNKTAKLLGIGRGADVVIYLSIVLLFYLIFRTNVLIENLHQEITKIVREIALKENKKKKS
jgi:hypothetical protein